MFEFRSKHNQIRGSFSAGMAGIFLIEALLSVMLSGLLLSVLYEMYLINHQSYHLQSTLMRIQTNANTAIKILTDEIKMAGYIGCGKLTKDFPLNTSSFTLTLGSRLIGLAENAFVVSRAEFPNANLLEPTTDDNTLLTNNVIYFKPGDILIISDCKAAEIFRILEVHTLKDRQKIIPVKPLQHKFDQFAEVSHLQINKFYVAKTNRTHADGSNVNALFMENINGEKMEIVEDVQQMHILYAVKQDNKIIHKPATGIIDWSTVFGVAIDLDFYSSFHKKTWHVYVALNE